MSEFEGKIAIITGGAQGIGKCIAKQFEAAGATVCMFDVQENPGFVGDLANEEDIRRFAAEVLAAHGKVDFIINNAAPLFKGLPDCTWQEFNYALQVGVAALTHALAVSLAGRVRVNSISPGWIETRGAVYSGADVSQHPAGRVGVPEDIAHMVLYLCSAKAGFITGENICIDGGMTRQMIYHGEHGWNLQH